MECNRDESLRAREIAESKFMAKDIESAKRFALKAQNLYPGLEGISQMISTLDVYLSSQTVVNGEKDWYSILGVNVSADDEMVKKQYRKLALMLHPDKNKSVGAEGAFKLISDAWSVLSDKSRRMAYDKKRNVKGYQQRAAHPKRDSSSSHTTNGFYHFANSATSGAKTQKSTSRAAPSVFAHPNTFWTVCKRCKMQYEYLRVYLNHNLLCPTCHEPFLAIEIPVPTNGRNASTPWATQQRQQNVNLSNTSKNVFCPGKNTSAIPGMKSNGFQHGSNCDSYDNPNFQSGAFSRSAGAASAAASFSTSAQTVNMVHRAYKKVRRECKEVEAAEKKEETLQRKNHISSKTPGTEFSGSSNACFNNSVPNWEHSNVPKVDRPSKKRRGIGDDGGTDHRGDDSEGNSVVGNVNKIFNHNTSLFETERVNTVASDPGKIRLTTRQSSGFGREFTQMDIRNMLIQKAKVVVQKKLEELNSAAAAALAETEKAKQKQKLSVNQKEKEKENAEVSLVTVKNKKLDKTRNKQNSGKMASPNGVCIETEKVVQELISINVPDPDFHDFDVDRSERSFAADQVWATYDDEDGMPRLYVMVQKVLSLKPFKIRLSFLNAFKGTSEFGQLNWMGSGFAKSCGDFRIGRYVIRDTVNIFSHRVRWEKGSRGAIRIVPRKGEIWALYRNWSLDWNVQTPDDIIHKYDMVEVLEDYTEEGVQVTPLVKVAGFKTVFHRHLDPEEVRRIPREGMYRFSHQVPCYMLTGEEAVNAPKGCCELDPAATPLEMLQVITEAEEQVAEMVQQLSAS